MKIGLDYGGVISFAPDGWSKTVMKAIDNGHRVYIISHVQPGEARQLKMRRDFCEQSGAINLTFSGIDWHTNKRGAGEEKAQLCRDHGIELFIDDDLTMCEMVSKGCDRCAVLYAPINLWQVGQRLVDGLTKDW